MAVAAVNGSSGSGGALGYASCLLIVVTIALTYSNSLQHEFTFDDSSAIVFNRFVHTNETDWWSVFWVDYWGTPIQSEHSHKSYRPLTSLTFRLNYLFSGLEPYWYHLTNVALHCLVCLIYYRFMKNLLKDHWPCLLLCLFFAVHPLKSEAVSGIVGRAELLSTFFFLISLFCYFDCAYFSFALYTILATLCKEQGLTVPGVCISLEFLNLYFHWQSLRPLNLCTRLLRAAMHYSSKRILYLLVFTLALIVARISVMGSLPRFSKFDNPASFEESPTRQLTYNYLLSLNAYLMLYPKSLCADWTMNSVPLVQDWHDTRNLYTLAFYITLLALMLRATLQLSRRTDSENVSPNVFSISTHNDKTCLSVGLCLLIIPFLPASNLLFPVGFVIAERVLYTPSIGYCLILAIGLIRVRNLVRSRFFTVVLYSSTLLVIIALATRTYFRNFDWQNDLTLFTSGLEVNGNNAKLYNNIGHFYERKQQYGKALSFFKQAASKDSEDIGSELNIARTLIQLKRTDEAEGLLWRIKPRVRSSAIRNRIVPNYLNLWINLARVISMNDSRLLEAENLYREVISIRRDFVDAHINLGEIFIRRMQYDEAIKVYEEALSLIEFKKDLKAADLYYNIAIAKTLQLDHSQSNSSKMDKAHKPLMLADGQLIDIANNLARAIAINANHKEALINLAILVQKPNFIESNRTYYREYVLKALQAYTKSEEQELVEFNIAILLLDLGGPSNRLDAMEHLKKAIQLKPDFRSALYNLALLYYDFRDYNNSLHYLKQIGQYHSNYSKAALLMADIYSKLKQMDLAEKTYVKVLEYEHDNYEALHNLYLIYKLSHRLNEFDKYLSRLNASRL